MNKNISLVLSGGGARGIAHIGVIEVLLESGYDIKAISGTSMGALVGGVYASGTMNSFKEWLVGCEIKDAIKILDFSFTSAGLIKGEKFMKKLQTYLPYQNIESLPIPFTAVATDILSQTEIVMKDGNLANAIRASIAIPSVFTPLIQGEMMLVDGGLINNIPINHVKGKKDNLTVVVDVNSDIPLCKEYQKIMAPSPKHESIYLGKLISIKNHIKTKVKSFSETDDIIKLKYAELIDRSIHLLIAEVSKHVIKDNPPDILIKIPRKMCGTFDFLKADRIIDVGRLAMMKGLAEWELT